VARGRSPATLADLEALPEGVRGEIIDGVLYMSPRPGFAHMFALGQLVASNARYDLTTKRAFYARLGVPHLWYVDLTSRVLTVSELQGGGWMELGVFADGDRMRAKPFEAIELDVSRLWATPAEQGGGA
jgi:hypothetical protein